MRVHSASYEAGFGRARPSSMWRGGTTRRGSPAPEARCCHARSSKSAVTPGVVGHRGAPVTRAPAASSYRYEHVENCRCRRVRHHWSSTRSRPRRGRAPRDRPHPLCNQAARVACAGRHTGCRRRPRRPTALRRRARRPRPLKCAFRSVASCVSGDGLRCVRRGKGASGSPCARPASA